jgi:preprotein translocase subunit SecA
MFSSLKKAIFGNSNDRNIKTMSPLVEQINGLEEQIASLDDACVARPDQCFS